MFRKRINVIVIAVLLAAGLLIVFKILQYNNLFPSLTGRLMINEGEKVTTVPAQEAVNSLEPTGVPVSGGGSALESISGSGQKSEPYQVSGTDQESKPELGANSTSVPAGQIPPEEKPVQEAGASDTISQEDASMFHYTELAQEIKDRITGVSYADNCEVPYSELRYVQVLYWGFDGESHSGEMIVNKAIAADVVDIFKELYEAKYPIERMVLIDEYNADDNASMAANNTSAFCYRVIDNGSKRLSNHSYGLAIDINPLYNPYVRPIDGKTVISPEEGAEYADRTLDNPYYIRKGDICYQAFTSRGFTWGGDWKNPKDYQHFEKKLD